MLLPILFWFHILFYTINTLLICYDALFNLQKRLQIHLFHCYRIAKVPLQWRHDERDGVLNHRHLDCLLNRLFGRISRKTSKLRVTGFVRGIHRWPVNSPHKGPVTREIFPFDDLIMQNHALFLGNHQRAKIMYGHHDEMHSPKSLEFFYFINVLAKVSF